MREYPPERGAQITGLAVGEIIDLARDYGAIESAAMRLNYGMQRHAGGAMAVRTVACLPALIGAWRDPAGGALLASSGTYPVNTRALERPDLIWNGPCTINMSTIGNGNMVTSQALTDLGRAATFYDVLVEVERAY